MKLIKTQDNIRKVRKKNLFRVTVEVVNEATGASHSIRLFKPSKGAAKGLRAMFLRNATQGKSVTQVAI
jgi:hypothetical protein